VKAGGAVALVVGGSVLLYACGCGGRGDAQSSGTTTTRRVPIATAQPVAPAPRVRAHRPASDMAGQTILVDPGHNGANKDHAAQINRLVDAGTLRKPCDTTGAATDGGYPEADFNWDVAQRVARLLRARGAKVVMTRHDNTSWGPCITRRAQIGNTAGATAAISIHADGGPAGGRGFHVIRPAAIRGLTEDIARPSHRLALALRHAYRLGTVMPYADYTGARGLDVRSDLGGLNLSDVPKVFLEAGNMRNARDAALLTSPAFRQRAARAIAEGLARFVATRGR
jgi:N-acetylmuramoyl-L-alanine amidase